MAGPAFTRSGRKPPNQATLALLAALLCAPGAHAQAPIQVQEQSLAAPDLFSVGAATSDLPPDVWKGSSAALARLVLPEIADKPLTPAAMALARHVLSAPARAPDGAGDDADLAGLRAQALLALGQLEVVSTITDRTPVLPQKPALSQAAAQAALIRGQEDQACAIGDALGEGRDRAFWLRLRAYCQVRAGQTAAAQLTFELASQQSHSPDYERLMSALLAGKDAGAPALDSGLDLAISRRASAAWSQGLTHAAAPIAITLARDASAPPDARLEAAARAARLGVDIPDAYAALQPLPVDVAAADQPGAAGEAALVALASATTDYSLKEAAVIALLKRAKDGPEFQALARLSEFQIAQILSAGPVLREPALFAMAAAAAGDRASAKRARAQAGVKGAPLPLSLDLALLDALIAAASDQDQGAAIEALDAQLGASDAAGRTRAAAAMALLGALGAPAGPQARLDIAGSEIGPDLVPPGRLQALQLAASQRRVGDVALYVLQTCADAGAAGPSAATRASLVRALNDAGLKADAQAFAIEGLLPLQARP